MKICNYELAKKLKEKGFPIKTKTEGKWGLTELKEVDTLPTISQVLKWLREEKEVDLIIEPIYFFDKDKHREYSVRIFAPPLNKPVSCGYFSTWEETALTGIEYVLDNLV